MMLATLYDVGDEECSSRIWGEAAWWHARLILMLSAVCVSVVADDSLVLRGDPPQLTSPEQRGGGRRILRTQHVLRYSSCCRLANSCKQ